MIETQEQLLAVFNSNFVAYYRSHVAHANIIGRNFYSDHKLLGKIYEHLQGRIDILAEQLRTLGSFMPSYLNLVIVDSHIDDDPMRGTSQDMLEAVRLDLVKLTELYQELVRVAELDGAVDIADSAQGELGDLNKFLWMMDATLLPEQ